MPKLENTMIEISRFVAENSCYYASEVDGDHVCFYCESLINYEPHDADCPYIKAVEVIKQIDEVKNA